MEWFLIGVLIFLGFYLAPWVIGFIGAIIVGIVMIVSVFVDYLKGDKL